MTTTSDKELLSPKDDERMLLELAAKAGGYIVEYGVDWWNEQDLHLNGNIWNPLTDDGDALRLAVKLGLTVCVSFKYGLTWADKDDKGHDLAKANHDGDPYAATRRAIVRAAAMVGESM